MPVPSIRGYHRLPKTHKFSTAGIAAAGAVALAFAVVPGQSDAKPNSTALSAQPVALAQAAFGGKALHSSLTQQSQTAQKQAKTEAIARKTAAVNAEQKATADALKSRQVKAAADMKAAKERTAGQSAAKERSGKTASRSAARLPVPTTYADNLDGWIKESLSILQKKGIPASYEGIHRNVMRESSGDPQAMNDWDVNAVAGIPSKGLLQVIPPTFKAFHVEGTSWNIYDPVANITAACNYAAQKYGSMDNVDSAY
ncbi:transglycosylase SLT domain-containing protein [Streptomyces zagrosensis]|uniref:SLT domain-containing protein n=1 Tax=Streptomyces zagrosensis TaxID=1042984 RepID=A0A7W9Q5G8_9ACTN|nr:transglycosylase SLT domain-containing protein [Streptomyces zagrosensis]MBB5933729.1 SLT domain-containing protein [Streptomyces zagrosensis]